VQNIWYNWVHNLVSEYSSMSPIHTYLTSCLTHTIVDGLRVDTVRHVQKDFWPAYNKAAGVYCVGEVFEGDADYTCGYQDVMDGILNYPM
jgi:alpha-amylase